MKAEIGSRYFVVTGASEGLGRCFALELARKGINLILIALPGRALEELAESIKNQGPDCVAVGADLTDKKALFSVCAELMDYDICGLINDAGTGGTRSFTACDSKYIDNIIQLNVTASTLLTHGLLPSIIKGGGGWILNVSSMAAFSPIGFKTVYPATKRFVMDFSAGLREELSGQNVMVSVVYPGAMRTNRDVTDRIIAQGIMGRLSEQSPEYVARVSLRGMFNGKATIVPGLNNKLNRFFLGLVPAWIRVPVMSKVVSKELKVNAI